MPAAAVPRSTGMHLRLLNGMLLLGRLVGPFAPAAVPAPVLQLGVEACDKAGVAQAFMPLSPAPASPIVLQARPNHAHWSP